MRDRQTPELKTPAGVAALVALLGIAVVVAGDRIPNQPDRDSLEGDVAVTGTSAASPVQASDRALAVEDESPAVPTAGIDHGAAEDPDVSDEALTGVVRRVCVTCHNDQLETADLSLQTFDVANAAERAETAEKMIQKLRLDMMPPPGIPRPGGDTLTALVERLEQKVDQAVAERPDPGARAFQRLNRIEYEQSIREVLGLEVDASDYLPPDTRMASFDNLTDAQLLSPTLIDSYLAAADEISRLAIGDPDASPTSTTYQRSGYASQWERVEGAPMGTRGGISVVHNFPADGEYVLTMTFENTTTGGMYGNVTQNEQIDISLDGEQLVLLEVDQWMHSSDPHGVTMRTEPLFIPAGPHRLTASFVNLFDGPVEDLTSPHDWSIADRRIGAGGYGITALTHMKDLTVNGPHNPQGVSEHPVRERIFTCRPETEEEERPCAREIISGLAEDAYRRSLEEGELDELMGFFERGREDGGFDEGVRVALQAILASPDFIFRFEPPAEGATTEEEAYRISDAALASRLSFFLWGSPPDSELRRLAREGRLSDPAVLEEQVWRMLGDERAEALATRFASQWLRLHDIEQINPDAFWFPDFDQQLAEAMRRETELLFYDIVREDRSVLTLLDADYTFVNERLAKHYGMPDVSGDSFRRVEVKDERRHGLLGHAGILTLTSHANRTSPVNRGLWVLEVLLGTEPPPPPPVPALDETAASEDGEFLTTRERMELHRSNPTCNACHQFIDPLGVALENFDVTGKWRIREDGRPLDSRDTMWDGTELTGPADLREVVKSRPVPVLRHFTQQMMTYALGRRVEYTDMPTVRRIVDEAAENDYRLSSFVLGIVKSDQFQMQGAAERRADDEAHDHR